MPRKVPLLLLAIPLGCGSIPGGGASLPPPPPPAVPTLSSNRAAHDFGGGCFPQGAKTDPLVGQYVLVNPHWAPVVNGTSPEADPVRVEGTAYESHGDVGGDYPPDHATPDATAALEPDPPYRGLLATGNFSDPTAPERGRMELEWEAGSWPAWARPADGDRIVALGRWVFDCGHMDAVAGNCSATTGESCLIDDDCRPPACSRCDVAERCVGQRFGYQTEIHPPQATAVLRRGGAAPLSTDPSAPAVPVTRVDLYASADGGGAGDRCLQTHRDDPLSLLKLECWPLSEPLAPLHRYDLAFEVPLPPPPPSGVPAWRVESHDVPGGVPAGIEILPDPSASPPSLRVRVKLASPTGGKLPTGVAATLYAGWRGSGPPATRLRLTIEEIDVVNALKPTVPVVRRADGWVLQASVNGVGEVIPALGEVRSGDRVPESVVFETALPSDGSLHFLVNGTSRGCIDTLFGRSLRTDLTEMSLTDLAQCLLSPGADPGIAEATYRGPDFGSGGGSLDRTIASVGGDAGTCSPGGGWGCVADADCALGQRCTKGGGAFAVRFRIESIP